MVMVGTRHAIRFAVPGLCAGLLALPSAALAAGTGGTQAPSSPLPATGAPAPSTTAGALAVTPTSVVERQVAVVSGTVPAAEAGRAVWLQVRAGRAWTTIARTRAAASGSFAIPWRTNRAGELTLRVVAGGIASKSAVTATPQVTLSVYLPIIATWYGPGFFGNHTACGELLTTTLVGVADRTLPCGTPVSVTYDGHTLTVPVIDRGPYSGAATLDLTEAAAQELGMSETSPVGMLPLGGPPLAPSQWSPAGSSSGPTGPSGASGGVNAGGATAPS
jgi:rare lipoprotein A